MMNMKFSSYSLLVMGIFRKGNRLVSYPECLGLFNLQHAMLCIDCKLRKQTSEILENKTYTGLIVI